VVVDGEGLGTGCEAVAVTVAVTEAAVLGEAPVLAFFAEQAAVSRAATASMARHRSHEVNGRDWGIRE